MNDQGSNNYSNTYVLPSSGFVNITVIANDTLGLINDSEFVTIEVLDTLILDLYDSSIDLGEIDLGSTKNSENVSDFVSIRNDGSLDMDVYVYGYNSPFTSITGGANVLPTDKFKVHSNSSQSGSNNVTYVNMPANFSTKHLLVDALQADDSFDESNLGVELTVPNDEANGGKNAIFTVYVEAD